MSSYNKYQNVHIVFFCSVYLYPAVRLFWIVEKYLPYRGCSNDSQQDLYSMTLDATQSILYVINFTYFSLPYKEGCHGDISSFCFTTKCKTVLFQTLFLKPVHTFSHINCKTGTVLDQGGRLVPNGHILTCFARGALCLRGIYP